MLPHLLSVSFGVPRFRNLGNLQRIVNLEPLWVNLFCCRSGGSFRQVAGTSPPPAFAWPARAVSRESASAVPAKLDRPAQAAYQGGSTQAPQPFSAVTSAARGRNDASVRGFTGGPGRLFFQQRRSR